MLSSQCVEYTTPINTTSIGLEFLLHPLPSFLLQQLPLLALINPNNNRTWVSMEKENRRILILDDDLDNLQLTKDMLQFSGFETYDFLNPRLALDAYKQNPHLYDLILVDVKMEEMDGRLVYKEIKQINPNAKVLVFTGLQLDVNDFKNICPSFNEKQVIRKPVTMSSLVKTINQAL